MANQYTPGRFVWRELMTKDASRAKAFYAELFGWRLEEVDMGPGGTYVLAYKGDKQIGGIFPAPAEMQMPSMWSSYVSVNDVDAATAAVKQHGGQVYMDPKDIPDVGRFSMIADPDGAVVALFHSSKGDQTPSVPGVGEFCWESLITKNVEKAITFYSKVTGWKSTKSMGMPTFNVGEGSENQVADIGVAQSHPAMWATYVVVEKLEPSRDRSAKLGATILEPLIEVPGIGRIAFIQDPTGASIGLFEPAQQ